MPKSLKIYIFLLVLILIGIIWADATKEKPIDWSESYSLNEKSPFGLLPHTKTHPGGWPRRPRTQPRPVRRLRLQYSPQQGWKHRAA